MTDPLQRTPKTISHLESSYERRLPIWKAISPETWSDWRWQFKNRLLTLKNLQAALSTTLDDNMAVSLCAEGFSMAISPHYASLIRQELGENCPIRRQCIPSMQEFAQPTDYSYEDPLGEDAHQKGENLIQRYPDRVLLYATESCAMRCRHCTRRRKVGRIDTHPSLKTLHQAIDQIAEMPNIRDCLISGGDPLTLPNETLRDLLSRLRNIPHLDVIRLCSRTPVTLPQRIDEELCNILTEFGPLYFNTHFNHPFEATVESQNALRKIQRTGTILGNQMVLLRGINDDPDTVESLNRWLLRNGCRPYYIFQLDAGHGIQHFQTPLDTGIHIIEALRGRVSGLAIPHFAVDLPCGYGKVTLTPNVIEKRDGNIVTFKNWYGKCVTYRDCDKPTFSQNIQDNKNNDSFLNRSK